MINPTRIVFEARTRTAQVDVINNGPATATYRISLVRKRMTERGEFVNVDTALPGENFAEGMIRFSPRQVTLPPGGSQIVRLQVHRPADLAAGEYRSHLVFQALPPASPPRPADNQKANASGAIDIKLTAILSISIPLIVRQGETAATVSFANVALTPQSATAASPLLTFDLLREGNRSVYGDVIAYFTRRGGKELVVGRANGVAVYVPNDRRRAQLFLQLPSNQKLADGRLHVSFVDRPESGGRLLADAGLDLP
jgi:hypothetical protein